jgi:hypothetical protein
MTSEHDGDGSKRRTGFLIGVASVAVVLAAVAVVAVTDDDDDPGAAAPTTTTTAPSTTTTTAPADLSTAVWPASGSGIEIKDPAETARRFAVDFLGFVDPVVGEFMAGDARSGEVEIRPTRDGPVTTVFVRLLGTTGAWFVLGAATGAIQIEAPEALAAISSPVRLQGRSTAFEANVQTELRVDGVRKPIAEGYVMGGSMGEMGPFDGTLAFPNPSAPSGALILSTYSMENGNIWEASVLRVHFAVTAGGY